MDASEIGLPKHWELKTLVQLTEPKNISYGIVQPGKHDSDGVPIIRVNNFNAIGLDVSDALRVTPDIAKKALKTKLKTNDVLLTLVGSTGLTYIVPQKYEGWNVARAVAVIRTDNTVSADWIKICLDSDFTKHFLDSRANTTVQKTINLVDVKLIPIPVPPVKERGFIEKTIVDLNNKIILNFETNQTLENMAQALFQSWFVDFDPVFDNALAAGTNVSDFPEALQQRAELRKQAQQLPDFKALPDDIRALCPSEFEQTEEPHFGIFGWIPKGWKVSELSEFIKFANGKAKKHSSDGSYPIYGANGIIGNTDEVKFKNAVIVGRVGAYCGAIEYCRSDFWSSDNTIVATSKLSEEQIPHILYLLKHLDLNQYAGGAAQPLLNQTTLNKLKIPFAGIDSMMQFNEIVDALLVKQIKNIEQTTKLNEIRNILLPKLISGELTIPDSIKTENNVNHQQPKEPLSHHA
jgi:type I restriction enzyme S subunit